MTNTGNKLIKISTYAVLDTDISGTIQSYKSSLKDRNCNAYHKMYFVQCM